MPDQNPGSLGPTSRESTDVIEAWRKSINDEREAITDAAIANLSVREQRLVREAAVMGYVLGGLGGGHPADQPFPRDTWIYRHVVCECAKAPDRFPFIAGPAASPVTEGDS